MTKLLVMGDARSVHIERWCRYFADVGFEVALFSLEPCDISFSGKFYSAKSRTSIGLIKYWLATKDLLHVLDEFEPDIVNAHFIASYGWMASFCSRCPVIATAWGSDLLILPRKSFIHRRRVIRALEHAACCTVDSGNLYASAAQYMDEERIVRVVMGVDRDFFNTAKPEESTTSGSLRVIAPRGLDDVYDPETIINAAELLKGKVDFQIDLLGKGPRAQKIKKQIEDKSLSEIINLQPFQPHDKFAQKLKNYDIYLSASLSDSTSVALLEAMTVGLFPVVSDIEGNREWIEDGVNGITFPPGAAESLMVALQRAAAMKSEFESVAKINRDRVEGEAIWENNMDGLKDIILEHLGHE
jgi:glycosyltransferase involved in cell wall biosynthesis